jgi:hypothetical protein
MSYSFNPFTGKFDLISIEKARFYVPNKTVQVKSSVTEETGLIYNTIASALTYIAAQTPATNNRWGIMISGDNSENFTIPAWVAILGDGYTARLTGRITAVTPSDFDTVFIQDCDISDLRFATGTGGMINRCTIRGGILGEQAIVYVIDCTVRGSIDFSDVYQGSAFVRCIIADNVVCGGRYAGATSVCQYNHCEFVNTTGGLTFTDGRYFDCSFDVNGISAITPTAAHAMTFDSCLFQGTSMTVTIPSTAEVILLNTQAKDITFHYDVGGTLTTYNSIFIPDDGGGTFNNYGSFYDNSVSGLTATEFQDAIDELVSLVGSFVPYTGATGSVDIGVNDMKAASFTIGFDSIDSFTNLNSLSGLTYATTSFVKMTSANGFTLDTNTYLTAEADTLSDVIGRGSTTGTAVTFTTTTPIYFRDTGVYICSLNDGYLDLEADTGIRFGADTVITGNITASNLDNGTMSGQLIWFDGTKWTYLSTTEVYWDDVNKRLGINLSGDSYSADITGSGTPSANSEYPGDYYDHNAFDNNTATRWASNMGATGWLKYDLGAGNEAAVCRYRIYGPTSADCAHSWTFEGSNTGTFGGEETILDTQADQGPNIHAQWHTYDFSNLTAYRYYRWNVSENEGGTANGISISEVEMMTGGAITPDTTVHIGGNVTIGKGEADTDYTLTFDGETNDGVITWMEDEDQFKFSDRLQTDGGRIGKITTATDTYTILVSDETIICNKSSVFTVTLPTAVVGQMFHIKNIGAGLVTLDGAGSDTIDGSLTQALAQWEGITVQCNVVNSWIVY